MEISLEKIAEKLSIEKFLEWYKREALNDDYPPADKAVLLYQIARIEDIFFNNHAEAVRNHLLAYKQDATFSLPVLSAAGILFATSSFERLQRLAEAAYEDVTDPGVRSAVLMLLVEALTAQKQQAQTFDHLKAIEDAGRYPFHALLMHESAFLETGGGEAAGEVVGQWKAITASSVVRAHLSLELARMAEARGDRAGALDHLREAAYSGRDSFPVLPDVIRSGTGSGGARWLEEMLVEDIDTLLSSGDPAARFLLALPASPLEAALMQSLLLSAFGAAARTPFAPHTREQLYKVMQEAGASGGIWPGPFTRLQWGRDALDREGYAALLDRLAGERLDPLERAFVHWSRVRADLARGDSDGAARGIAEVRRLGLDSPVLRSLESLLQLRLGRWDEMLGRLETLPPDEQRAAGTAAITTDLLLFCRGDFGGAARLLAERGRLSQGLEDAAYVAAVQCGDVALREKALETRCGDAPGGHPVGAAQLLKLHAFERPDAEKLASLAGSFTPAARDAAVWQSLAAFWRLSSAGERARAAGFLDRLAAGVDTTAFAGFLFKEWKAELLRLEQSREHWETAQLEVPPHALSCHYLLAAAARRGDADTVAASILDQLDGGEGRALPASFLLHAARTALRTGVDKVTARRLADALAGGGEAGRAVAGLSLLATIRKGGPLELLDAIVRGAPDPVGAGEEAPALRAGLGVLHALHRLFVQRDFDEAPRALPWDGETPPPDWESLSLLLFSLPLAGRWTDWASLWGAVRGVVPEEGYEADMEATAMLVHLAGAGDAARAAESARRVLAARADDPAALLVELAGSIGAGDGARFAQSLRRVGGWFGEGAGRCRVAWHARMISSIGRPQAAGGGDARFVPDIVNTDPDLAASIEEGLAAFDDQALEHQLAAIGRIADARFRSVALVELGEMLEDAGRLRPALRVFDEALGEGQGEVGAILGSIRIAQALVDNGRLGAALELYGSITGDALAAAARYVQAAESYAKAEGRDDDSLRCFEKACALDPADDRCFRGFVAAIEKKGDTGRLIPMIEKRIAMINNFGELCSLYLQLSDLKRQARDLEGALETLENFLLLVQDGGADHLTGLRMKMDVLMQMDRTEEAFKVGEWLVDNLEEGKTRRGVLQKLINLAFQKLGAPERGLDFCIRLIGEGERDEGFINKAIRIALKFERWEDAASLQELLVAGCGSCEERSAMLLKKAEIHLRYERDPAKAEEIYKRVLRDDPACGEALTRWAAARGARPIAAEEIEEFVDRAHETLEQDPLAAGAINLLGRAHRIMGDAASARYFEALADALAGSSARRPATAAAQRPSVPTILKWPAGSFDAEDIEGLFTQDAAVRAINEAVRVLGWRESFASLRLAGVIRGTTGEVRPEEGTPVGKLAAAWGTAFGVSPLAVMRSERQTEAVGIHCDHPAAVTLGAEAAYPLPPPQLFRLGCSLFHVAQGLTVLNLIDAENVFGVIAAALRVAGQEGIALAPEEDFSPVFADMDAPVLQRIAAVLEGAGPLGREDVVRWRRTMQLGALKAGHLVAGKLDGIFSFLRPGLALEEKTPQEIAALLAGDELLHGTLGFALSRRYEILRQVVGLDL